MEKPANDKHGASPLPKGKRKPGVPLFKKPKPTEEKNRERDRTGQTDTTVKEMKQRLAEVPKKSAGSKNDKEEFENKKASRR